MQNYKLFADTDCDISYYEAKDMGLSLISMPYSINGKEVKPYEDFKEFNAKGFYDLLRNGVVPSTSSIDVNSYIKYFEPVFADGFDILYVHFSPAISMTFNNMEEALKTLHEKYPDRKLYRVNTKGISVMGKAIAAEVVKMYREGKTAEEIVKWSETETDHFALYYIVDDLKYLKHSGRVSGLSASMGTLLGVRPIIYMSPEGKMETQGTVKGRIKAIQSIISKMKEFGDRVEDFPVYIGQADCSEISEQMESMIKEQFPKATVLTTVLNPTIGSHCGPNCIGVCFHSAHR